ncbi:MAG TPA: phage major tail tube protein [Accumulibacter sp.]|nr:phage major tail tube protein [Accumulibacter sp.]
MASLPFLAVRGMNVFADSLNVGITNTGVKLPLPAETGESFTPGGARGAIEIMTSTEPCELAFSTKGIQPELLQLFAQGFGLRRPYTVLGALVDEYAESSTKRAVQLQATLVGRLSADIEKYEGGGLPGTEYTIKSVTKYTLQIGGIEVARYDLRLGGWLDTGGLQAEIASLIGLNV